MKLELTKSEIIAITRLKNLAKIWPKSLWLFSAAGHLEVMRNDENGHPVMTGVGEGVDPEYIITTIDIPNDGGDW